VGMLEPGQRLRLAKKALTRLIVLEQRRMGDLERNTPLEEFVIPLVYGAHTALPEHLGDVIPGELWKKVFPHT